MKFQRLVEFVTRWMYSACDSRHLIAWIIYLLSTWSWVAEAKPNTGSSIPSRYTCCQKSSRAQKVHLLKTSLWSWRVGLQLDVTRSSSLLLAFHVYVSLSDLKGTKNPCFVLIYKKSLLKDDVARVHWIPHVAPHAQTPKGFFFSASGVCNDLEREKESDLEREWQDHHRWSHFHFWPSS